MDNDTILEIREKLNASEEVRKDFASKLLEKISGDFYRGFRSIVPFYSVEELLKLFDFWTLNDFFSDRYKGQQYKFFAVLMEKNSDETIKCILQDNYMFDYFFESSDNFYSLFYNISYESFRNLILKMGDDIVNYPNYFIGSVSAENQRMLLKEDLSFDVLAYLIPKFKTEVINDFFAKDPRAIVLAEKVNIRSLIDNGIKFSDEIIKKKEFFNKLKSNDLVSFRSAINKLEKISNFEIIEKHLRDYYDEIIASYDRETGMFKDYLPLVNGTNFMMYSSTNPFVMDTRIDYRIYDYTDWDENNKRVVADREGLTNFLRDLTSKKLSELVVDALFEDNIYNVWLNLREMLRYNAKLSDDQKVIDDERREFYEMILNFDNVSSEEKVNLYNSLKDKKISYVFYDDLRKLKDLSYDLIKKDLFDVNDEKNIINLNNELTSAYGVNIYDMRDQEYTMLIRGQGKFRDQSTYRRNCYSVIGNENSVSFGDPSDSFLYYGYNSFEADRVLHALEQDSFSSDLKDGSSSSFVNRIMTSDELVRGSSSFSEINLVNLMGENGRYIAKKPDYLVFYDGKCDINVYVNEAKRLNIPIVMIREKRLSMDRKTDVKLDYRHDKYIDYHDGELQQMRSGGFGR